MKIWVAAKNRPITATINKLNNKNKGKSISTFGFSSLHTNLAHYKLLSILYKLLDFEFNDGGHKFITISKFAPCWSKESSDYKICKYASMQYKICIKYALNCSITIGLKLFLSNHQIALGSDQAPFFFLSLSLSLSLSLYISIYIYICIYTLCVYKIYVYMIICVTIYLLSCYSWPSF